MIVCPPKSGASAAQDAADRNAAGRTRGGLQAEPPRAPLDVPPQWEQAAAEIVAEAPHRVLLLGGTDVGKSSFARFLAGRLLAAGHQVGLVDGDVGQKDVGPPATITLGYPQPGLDEIPPEAIHFVGDTSPTGLFLPILVGLARMVGLAGTRPVIIDTTGLIAGPGRLLKPWEIEAAAPQLIVAIERADELSAVLRAFRHLPTVRLRPSPLARRRSKAARQAARRLAFRRYFAAAEALDLPVAALAFQRAPLGALQPGLLCGVADADGSCAGLGIVEAVDPVTARLLLRTPLAPDRIRALQLGRLRIAADGRELGRILPEA